MSTQPDLSTQAAGAAADSDADTDFLLRYLRGRDASCPVCSYNLRDLASPRCPECGHLLRLTVGTVEPYLRAWILLMLCTCGCAAIGLFCAIITAEAGMPPPGYLGLSIVGFMCTIPLPLPVLVLRRRFLRYSRAQQWSIAFTALAVAVVLLAFFAMVLR